MFDVLAWLLWFVWPLAIALLLYKRQFDCLAAAATRAAVAVLDLSCLDPGVQKCMLEAPRMALLRGSAQAAWVAIGVQLMTNELPLPLRWIQFLFLNAVLTVTHVAFSLANPPWEVVAEFLVCALVLPVNWRLTGQRVPFRSPRLYAPAFVLVFSFISFLSVYTRDLLHAQSLWDFGFVVAALLLHASRIDWTENATPTSSDISASTPRTPVELPSVVPQS